jgi:hypothetical protein
VAPTRDASSNKSDAFARAFADAQDIITNRSMAGESWPLLEIFRDKSDGSMKIVNAYLEPIIADALRKEKDSLGQEKDDDETLLDSLVKHISGEFCYLFSCFAFC